MPLRRQLIKGNEIFHKEWIDEVARSVPDFPLNSTTEIAIAGNVIDYGLENKINAEEGLEDLF